MTEFVHRMINYRTPGGTQQPAVEIGLPIHLRPQVIAGDRPPTVLIPLSDLYRFDEDAYCLRFFKDALNVLFGPGGWTRGEFVRLATLVEHLMWDLPQAGPPPKVKSKRDWENQMDKDGLVIKIDGETALDAS